MMLPEPALSGETSDVEADAECCDNDCDPSFHQGLAWTDGLSGHNSWHPHTEKFSVREYLLISPFQIIVNVQSLVIDHVYWSASHTVVTSDDGGGVTVLSVNVMQSVLQYTTDGIPSQRERPLLPQMYKHHAESLGGEERYAYLNIPNWFPTSRSVCSTVLDCIISSFQFNQPEWAPASFTVDSVCEEKSANLALIQKWNYCRVYLVL